MEELKEKLNSILKPRWYTQWSNYRAIKTNSKTGRELLSLYPQIKRTGIVMDNYKVYLSHNKKLIHIHK